MNSPNPHDLAESPFTKAVKLSVLPESNQKIAPLFEYRGLGITWPGVLVSLSAADSVLRVDRVFSAEWWCILRGLKSGLCLTAFGVFDDIADDACVAACSACSRGGRFN